MIARNLSILDLDAPLDAIEAEPAKRRWTFERLLVLAIAAMAAALGLSFAAAPLSRTLATGFRQPPPQISFNLDEIGAVETMSVDDKSQIIVEGKAAQEQNATIPFASLPLEQVQAFGIAAGNAETYATALRCLTQAVYYEAAVEPIEGRRAVAQVVLNRVRHPAYPNSVCGVVYQGAERRTGCQFSFTCDGALLRTPAAGPWREAQEVARTALAGYVDPAVGTATHYHADYVLPQWAFQLGKIAQIGRHIFYRFNGGWGRAAAFNSRYAGLERIPALDFGALRERALADGLTIEVSGSPAETNAPGLTVPPDITDRHADTDVGGRIDMTKGWRPTIPDPVTSDSRLKALTGETAAAEAPKAVADSAAAPVETRQ